jgi:hypothetical protein
MTEHGRLEPDGFACAQQEMRSMVEFQFDPRALRRDDELVLEHGVAKPQLALLPVRASREDDALEFDNMSDGGCLCHVATAP